MSELPPPGAPSALPLRVLMLEDSRFDAELLGEALRAAYPHAQVELVRDEEGYTGALQAGGWDVILSDYEIPGYSGALALEHAHAAVPQTPFIFVSGVIGEDNAVEMLKRGATDYVSKGRLARLPVVLERALREVRERGARGLAESRLREADALYARVVDSLRDYAVILLDTEGRIRSWNRAAREIFGYERDQLLGKPADILFTPDDRVAGAFAAEMQQALRTGKGNDDRWMQRSDGLQLWAEGVLTPLYGDGQEHTGFCKVVRDATAGYRDGQALRAAKDEAERASQTKDRFLAVLSHELRTPLTPISSAASLLERVAEVPEKYRDLLPMIRRNVDLEARLIADLLDLTAISAGKVSLRMAPVDMHALVETVAGMLVEQARDKDVRLALELDASAAIVQADALRMQQVVWNLVRNAIKFTPAGGRVLLRSSNDARSFRLECVDDGVGIAPEALPRIFQPFEQANSGSGGLGLGLAIARGLVAEHGGTLDARSEGEGRGATFELSLRGPVAAPSQPAPAEPAAEQAHGAHVLLVEDNIDAAETLAMCLEAYGWRVTHAATCAAALEAGKAGGFDVVLTDLGLPDGSGIDIGRALSPMVPVVALSGYGAAPDFKRSSMAGFAGHLVKPASPDEVHATLQKVLAAVQA